MSRTPLYSTPLGTNTTNRTTSPSDLIPVGTKSPDPTSPALPTDLPREPEPDPSLSDSSSKKYIFSNYSNSSKSKKNKRDKKKKRRKHNKQDASDPSSSNNSDFSYDSDYIRKQRKRKSKWKKGSDKIMRTFNGKVADDSI